MHPQPPGPPVEELARRADRAMRTFRARSIAESTYSLVRDALLSAEDGSAEARVFGALAKHPGWSRKSDTEFVCRFGGRSAVLTVPRPFRADQFARLITRVEVNVCLGGGADDALMRELQALAQRELQGLFDNEGE
jgi:hypothetical protein